MKLTFSVLLLAAVLTACFADNCYDMAAFAANAGKMKADCQSKIDAAAEADKMKVGMICCLTNKGAIDGNNVIYDKLREAATKPALPGKDAIVGAAYDACKDKFTTADKILDGKMCVFDKLKDQCSDVKAIGEKLGFA